MSEQTERELASLAVNAANALRNEKRHYEIACGEIARLKERIAELESAGVEARAALASLCYDLEDPGSAALGALYLISQATTSVDAQPDCAAEALAMHDAQVIRQAAEVLEATERDDDAVNLLYTLADSTAKATKTSTAVAR